MPPGVIKIISRRSFQNEHKLPRLYYALQFIRPTLGQYGPLLHEDIGQILERAICGNSIKKGLHTDMHVYNSNFLGSEFMLHDSFSGITHAKCCLGIAFDTHHRHMLALIDDCETRRDRATGAEV